MCPGAVRKSLLFWLVLFRTSAGGAQFVDFPVQAALQLGALAGVERARRRAAGRSAGAGAAADEVGAGLAPALDAAAVHLKFNSFFKSF